MSAAIDETFFIRMSLGSKKKEMMSSTVSALYEICIGNRRALIDWSNTELSGWSSNETDKS